jgi:glycosyltransferase involved in cell wall biosynthesis
MRVAIVLNTSWNIYNFRMGLVKAFINKGYEVHAIAPHDEYSQKLVDLGCIYHRVKMDSRGVNPIKDFALTFELFSIYRKVKPDVVLHYTIKPNIYGTFAASLLKLPVINNVCGLGTSFLNQNFVSWVALKLYKLAFQFPKLVYFQNNDDKAFFIDNKIVSEDASDVLPGSGINLQKFEKADIEQKQDFTFLLVSRLIHDKGILEYIEAIKLLKTRGVNARFQLLGSKDTAHRRGIEENIITEWLNNDAVEYLGSTDDVRPYLKSSDCVVLPSYREGTPKSLIEAASTGRPIVTTDVAGCNNIVKEHVNGLLCKPMDAIDLADKMEMMINFDPSTREQMGKKGRLMVEERFGEDIVIDKYLSAISSIESAKHTS